MSATTSPPSASGGTQHADVSQEEFLHHMSAMQLQYRAAAPAGHAPVSLYRLPAHLAVMAQPAATGTGQPAVQASQRSVAVPVSNTAAAHVSLTVAKLTAVGTPAPAAQAIAEALHEQHQRMLAFITAQRDAMRESLASARDRVSQMTYKIDSLRTLLASLEAQDEDVRRAILELIPDAAAAAESVHAAQGFEAALDTLLREVSKATVVDDARSPARGSGGGNNGTRPAERVVGRMRHTDEQKAVRLVAKHRALLLVIWRRFHQ